VAAVGVVTARTVVDDHDPEVCTVEIGKTIEFGRHNILNL
jgi:hypothetical protein